MPDGALLNWGSYDIDNFGDLLFPFLVEHHLGAHYPRIVHVSPTGTRPRWPDARPSCTVAEALASTAFDGLLVGGGNLISSTASSSVNYVEDPEFARIVHASFAWIPYVLRAKYGIPYAYNLVGVAKPIPPEKASTVRALIAPAAYLSCRDHEGKERLRRAGVTSPIAVGPDSAIDIARVFPPGPLHDHYHREVREKYGIARDADLVVLHVKERYLRDQLDEVVRLAHMLRTSGLHPVFLPLGLCHRDDELLRDPRLRGGMATCVVRPVLLRDVLAILSVAKLYLGSSLHGAITALSYGKGAALVADEQASRLCKFSGFLAQVDLPGCLYRTWREACDAWMAEGVALFGHLSGSKVRELGCRSDTWEELRRSLQVRRHADGPLVIDRWLEASVRQYYGI